jgi:hypothetical protein
MGGLGETYLGGHIGERELNEALFWILDGDFDLCSEFKNLYISNYNQDPRFPMNPEKLFLAMEFIKNGFKLFLLKLMI